MPCFGVCCVAGHPRTSVENQQEHPTIRMPNSRESSLRGDVDGSGHGEVVEDAARGATTPCLTPSGGIGVLVDVRTDV